MNTAQEYKEKTQMKVLNNPFPDRMVLALRPGGFPFVYAIPLTNRKDEHVKWLITNDPSGRSYMFKEDGLFGFTDDWSDRAKILSVHLKKLLQLFIVFIEKSN